MSKRAWSGERLLRRLSRRLLLVHGIRELPTVLRPMTREDLTSFLDADARTLVTRLLIFSFNLAYWHT